LNQGLTETLPLMGEEKDMTYEGETLSGFFNERTESNELDFGGRNVTAECSFLIPQSEITAAAVTIAKDKKCVLDGITWKITGINTGPSATTLFLTNANNTSTP